MATPLPDHMDVRYCPAVLVRDLIPAIRRSEAPGKPAFARVGPSVREEGFVEPFLVVNCERGLVVEVGNHRLPIAVSMGVKAVGCIVSTAKGGPKPPTGERLRTLEDVMARLANPPESWYADDNLVVHFHDFTKGRVVPHGWAALGGRRGAQEQKFGSIATVVTLEPVKPCGSAWYDWRTATVATDVMSLSGSVWLLRAGPDGPARDSVRQDEMSEGDGSSLEAGERFCLRVYRGGRAEVALVPRHAQAQPFSRAH